MKLQMEYPLEVLTKSESVLMQRIRRMKDGEPKWAASTKYTERFPILASSSRGCNDSS